MTETKKKVRLDYMLMDRGLFQTRAQAHAAILAGEVFSNDQLLSKPGHLVARDLPVSLRSRHRRFVSRGGYKLEGALKEYKLDVHGWQCLDIGASTGGFTDCLLQQGAEGVCCLDVGRGQLEMHLRQDPRVKIFEGVNARYLDPTPWLNFFDLVVIDVSFISLTKIVPKVADVLKPRTGKMLALIKPQFEVGPTAIGKGGIVKDKQAVEGAIAGVVQSLAANRLAKLGVAPSCLKGMDGNQEYFLLAGVAA